MPDLSRCNLCGAVLRVVHYPGWGNEPVKHECRPVDLCHQCEASGECQARTPCKEDVSRLFEAPTP